jgi:hypothetical protein
MKNLYRTVASVIEKAHLAYTELGVEEEEKKTSQL